MKIKMTFTSPLLGTVSGNQELAKKYVIDKVLTDKTIEEDDKRKRTAKEEKTLPGTIGEQIEESSTYFHREGKRPFIYGYMIKGFFKAACDAMIDSGVFTKKDLNEVKLGRWSYKSTINKLIMVRTRKIMLQLPETVGEWNLPFVERSLRAETMKGDRICLARSEAAPEGTVVEFEFVCLSKKLQPYIEWWLNYGAEFGGIGQWRSAHYGSFSWEEIVTVGHGQVT